MPRPINPKVCLYDCRGHSFVAFFLAGFSLRLPPRPVLTCNPAAAISVAPSSRGGRRRLRLRFREGAAISRGEISSSSRGGSDAGGLRPPAARLGRGTSAATAISPQLYSLPGIRVSRSSRAPSPLRIFTRVRRRASSRRPGIHRGQ